MKKEPIFEIIVNGEVTEEVVGWDKFAEVENKYLELFFKQGFESLSSSSRGSSGYKLLFNRDTLKSSTFAWREFTGFLDMNGNRVYDGDILYDKEDDEEFLLNEYPEMDEKKGYYLRRTDSWRDIPIKGSEIRKKYMVIHCVFPDIVNNKLKDKQ